MPFDKYFTSKPIPTEPAREREETTATQIGRSDYVLGSWNNPFPVGGTDARDWQRGFEAERGLHRAPADGKNEKRLRELEAQE